MKWSDGFAFTWTLNWVSIQVVFENWTVASSLTSAYFPTDDDGEDDDEYYVQYKQHLRKVVPAALKNLDGQCIFLTGNPECLDVLISWFELHASLLLSMDINPKP